MTTLRQIWRGAAARSDHSAADRRNTPNGSHCFYTHPAFPEEHFAFVPWTVNISSSISLNTFVLMQHFSFSWLQNRQLTANSTATSAPLPHWTHQHIICITAEIRFHFHSLFSSSLNHRLETKWNSKNIRLIWQSEYLLELNWSRHYVSKGCLCLHSMKRKNRPHSPGVNTRIHYTNHLDDFTAESTKKTNTTKRALNASFLWHHSQRCVQIPVDREGLKCPRPVTKENSNTTKTLQQQTQSNLEIPLTPTAKAPCVHSSYPSTHQQPQ